MKSRLLLLTLLLTLATQIVWAQIPQTISYQGILTDATGKAVPDGNYSIAFKLYDVATAGTALWSEAQNIPVTKGMLNAIIGSVTPFNLPFDKQYWLGVTVGTGSELTPRLILTSSAYGLRAAEANRLFGFGVSPTPQPNNLLPLDATGKFPASVVTGNTAGDYIRRGTPDTSRGTSANPMLLISNLGNGDGINGRSIKAIGISGRSDSTEGVMGWTGGSAHSGVYGWSVVGTGISGRSDSTDGVIGWTGGSAHGGVYGLSTEGRGVVGRSDKSDGVVGWTGTTSRSGVFGHSTNGYGVTGMSDAQSGVYGTTTVNSQDYGGVSGYSETGIGVLGKSKDGVGISAISVNYNGIQARSKSSTNAAIAAGNEGAGPALYAQGGTNGIACVFRGNVQVQSLSTQATILELGEGLDYAERFDLSDNTQITPGTVLIIDPDNPGKLKVSTMSYDQKVAGIVAGAKGLGSGVRLGGSKYDKDVALAGRVYCNVDASYGEVTPGALLTTSPTAGYAMVVRDSDKASGAILGKAMESLPAGQKGQILVLVTLQ